MSSAAGVVAPQMNQFPFEATEEVCCKDSPCCFFAPPQPKGKALWRTSPKIREDLYAIDGLWQYDWRDGFASSTAVLSSKWVPAIAIAWGFYLTGRWKRKAVVPQKKQE